MVGSIDYMHREWKNCLTTWFGQYASRSDKTTIILEAVASYDLRICHAFFGTPGSCNDINALDCSPISSNLLVGRAPNGSYVVNGWESNMTYYLTDGICPSWGTFVKSIITPKIQNHKFFVEGSFRVLQVHFSFLRHPCLVWEKDDMGKIMISCIIIHTMIVEDERNTYFHYYDQNKFLNDISTNQQRNNSSQDDE